MTVTSPCSHWVKEFLWIWQNTWRTFSLALLHHFFTSYKLASFFSSEFAHVEITSDLLSVYSQSLCSCLFGIVSYCSCLLIKPLFLLALINQTLLTFLLPTLVFCFFSPPTPLWAHISFHFLILFPIVSIFIFLYTQFSLVVPSTSVIKKTNTLCGLVTAFFFGTKTVGII